jgi:hypothetical protein
LNQYAYYQRNFVVAQALIAYFFADSSIRGYVVQDGLSAGRRWTKELSNASFLLYK